MGEEEEEEEEENENEEEQEEEEEKEEKEKEKEEEKERPTIKELLESLYDAMMENEAACNDLVVGICRLWPINASYPIHFGAMLQMIIEEESKSDLYAFIVHHEHYHILQSHLKQYSGSELQGDIKQMANLCNTVGAEKFSSLSLNILQSFKNLLNGHKFQLDFGPLLKQTTTSNADTQSEANQTVQSKPKQ